MVTASSSSSSSSIISSPSPQPILVTIFHTKKTLQPHKPTTSSPLLSSFPSSISTISPSKRTHNKNYYNPPKPHPHGICISKNRRVCGLPENVSLSEANPVENSEQIVAANGDGVSNVISVLLFLAFVGLSVLTIGVIYIAVTDYLQKREREKFEKEEAAIKAKGNKKKKVKARAGPRGFGQKIDEVDDDI